MKKKWIIFIAICAILAVIFLAIGPIMSNVERPKYDVVKSFNAIEIRQYAPMILAEVQVKGERKQAIKEGFRLLADFIFGNNSVKHDVAVLASEALPQNEKISMTAPVQQQAAGNVWKISFVMPAEYNMSTLPMPNDDRVVLRQMQTKRYIVLRFSGESSNENVAAHEIQLLNYIKENQIKVIGEPKYAFYNPPWTLPIMRRNEIMFEMSD